MNMESQSGRLRKIQMRKKILINDMTNLNMSGKPI